jgi:soluble lytic murein transglycosylase-like protein
MTPRCNRSRRLRGASALIALVAVGAMSASAFAGTRYLIRPGDTLTSIASRLHVSIAALSAANHLQNPNRIYAGASLVVPGRAFAPDASPSSDPITPGPLAPVAAPPPGTPRYPAALLAHPDRLALRPYFRYWSRAYGVPAGLVEAVAWIESGWQTNVVSKTGAIGIGQIEPSTAVVVSHDILHLATTLDARLPDANIRLSAAYLAWLLWAAKGDLANAIGGYYEGLSTLQNKGVYDSARRYVANVAATWAALRSG